MVPTGSGWSGSRPTCGSRRASAGPARCHPRTCASSGQSLRTSSGGALPPEDVRKLWPELDVLVLPARPLPTWAEPAAHVAAEAMAYEVAVVGTSAGATPEVIGDAGVVVPPDDPLALSGALRRLASPDQRRPLAQAGRARAMQYFSDDAVAERTLGFWREVLGG